MLLTSLSLGAPTFPSGSTLLRGKAGTSSVSQVLIVQFGELIRTAGECERLLAFYDRNNKNEEKKEKKLKEMFKWMRVLRRKREDTHPASRETMT